MEEILALRIYKTLVGILGILGNGLVCLVIWRVSALHTRTNAFIFHQAVVDCLASILTVLQSEIPLPDIVPDNPLGMLVCVLWIRRGSLFVVFTTSTYNLMVMTMERYFAIVHPFKYQVAFSRHPRLKVGLTILLCWVAGAIVVLPSIIVVIRVKNGGCVSSRASGPNMVAVLNIILKYVAPSAVMLFAYIRIGVELKRGAARVGPSSGQATWMAESLLKARRNTFKTLLIVFFTFLVCWTPNQVFFLMLNLGHSLTFNAWYYLLSVALVSTNSCVNPVIYALKYHQFRKGLRGMLCGKSNRTDNTAISSVSTHNQP